METQQLLLVGRRAFCGAPSFKKGTKLGDNFFFFFFYSLSTGTKKLFLFTFFCAQLDPRLTILLFLSLSPSALLL